MTQGKRDVNNVLHLVKTKRFDQAAEQLLTGWGYQIKPKLVAATKKQLAKMWTQKYEMRKSAGYTTDDIAEEVVAETEDWFRELH